ncbi:Inner membrane transport protein YeaN [Streptomyces sp. YIM 121038]|uniref:MFS transporter n=1 Tax=Streptomyces sp. YIM 121038 TaxID=2136401 RepID=UPI001110B34D|nr:MFS transporter [Streptomyces sp. YIM 121038]QCX81741.1 Inner membrane transport protein YeaN [Streptomyces sp. YIM 121038]
MNSPAEPGATTSSGPDSLTAAATSTAPPARRLLPYALAVLLVGLNMRPVIVAVSALLDDIRHATGLSNGAAGVLSTLPLICFGVFAPLAPRLARRHGMERTLVAVLLLLLAGAAVRLVPALPPLFAGTFLIGAAVAVANVVVTALIKRDFHRHVGLMSGLHSAMLVGGGAVAAAATVPLRDGLGLDWSGGLALWGLLALVAVLVWAPRLRRGPARRPRAAPGPGGSLWRDRLAWAVALFYAFQSLIYYTATTWLPSFYISHGYSEGRAGVLLAVCMGFAMLTSLLVPVAAQRSRRQSHLAVLGSALCAVALIGLAAAPTGAATLWAALLGLGLGAVLSLGIAFMSMRARTIEEAGLLSAMSQCVGYLVAAVGPTLFGAVRDLSGHWTAGLVGLVVIAVPMAVTGALAGRGGHVRPH